MTALDSPPYRTIAEGFQAGRVVPFLGAAASFFHDPRGDASPPSAVKLAASLASRAEIAVSEDHEDIPCLAPTADCPSLNGLRRLLDAEHGDLAATATAFVIRHDREQLNQLVSSGVGGRFKPNVLHKFLARLAQQWPMLVVTTNYDDMVEQAFLDAGVPFHLVATVVGKTESPIGVMHRAPSGMTNSYSERHPRLDVGNLQDCSIVYKIHGTILRRSRSKKLQSFLITEDDYVCFLNQLSTGIVPPVISRLFRNRRFLFLGYSLRDWNLRVLLQSLSNPSGEEVKHWALRPSALEVDKHLWRLRKVHLYPVDLETFIVNLCSAIKQHPDGRA